jgi:hypothetical protein
MKESLQKNCLAIYILQDLIDVVVKPALGGDAVCCGSWKVCRRKLYCDAGNKSDVWSMQRLGDRWICTGFDVLKTGLLSSF